MIDPKFYEWWTPKTGDVVLQISGDDVLVAFTSEGGASMMRAGEINWKCNLDGTVKSFRILPPSSKHIPIMIDKDYKDLRISELEDELKRFVNAHRELSLDFEKLKSEYDKERLELDKENDRLRAEIAKYKPDPFAAPFKNGHVYFCVDECGYVQESSWIGSKEDEQRWSSGRAFADLLEAEQYSRIEKTRFELELLASKEEMRLVDLENMLDRVLNFNGVMRDEVKKCFSAIGKEDIQEFLEWKR